MARRLIAFLITLVLCTSLLPVALAVDVTEECQHPIIVTKQDVTYSSPDATTHLVTTQTYPYCNTCQMRVGNITTTSSRVAHRSDGTTYNYHSGNNHVFYLKCSLCKGKYSTTTVACPGNPHVSIILSTPNVTE